MLNKFPTLSSHITLSPISTKINKMSLKKDYFRIFLLLNIISITISLLREMSEINLVLTNTFVKTSFLLVLNISILILSKLKNISEKMNLGTSLTIVFLGYLLINLSYYPFMLNNLTFGFNFLITLIIVLLNKKQDLINITKRLTYIYIFFIFISYVVTYQLLKNGKFSINNNIKIDFVISIKDFILPLIWLMILVTNKSIILKITADNSRLH